MEDTPFDFLSHFKPPTARVAALAAAFATRLTSVAPAGISVTADRGNITVSAKDRSLGGSSAAYIIEDDDTRTTDEKVEAIAFAVLGGVQDSITEILTLEWPRAKDGSMALPGARVRNGRAHLWFGEESAPALLLAPIELRELLATP